MKTTRDTVLVNCTAVLFIASVTGQVMGIWGVFYITTACGKDIESGIKELFTGQCKETKVLPPTWDRQIPGRPLTGPVLALNSDKSVSHRSWSGSYWHCSSRSRDVLASGWTRNHLPVWMDPARMGYVIRGVLYRFISELTKWTRKYVSDKKNIKERTIRRRRNRIANVCHILSSGGSGRALKQHHPDK